MGAPAIATTHAGSLPPSAAMREAIPRATGDERRRLVEEATAEVVARQCELGIDIVNDGEVGKHSYATYVLERLAGFEGVDREGWPEPAELADFPEWAATREDITVALERPACDGDISYRDRGPVEADIAALRAAAGRSRPSGVFMSAASPGVVTMFLPDLHHPTHEAYVFAVADAMKAEYDAIHAAGFMLQLDCPDLAAGRNSQYPMLEHGPWMEIVALHVEALNHATRDIPPERMRMHVCWGNREGPHHRDVPLAELLPTLLRARPAGLSIEGANPRHEHEWKLFEEVKLPDDKVLYPGVIDSTTNFVEHPELVAQRLGRYAGVVGRERVVASTDCGFATLSTYLPVSPDVAWAKLRAMTEGAALV